MTAVKEQPVLADYLDGTPPQPPFSEPLFPDTLDRRSLKTSGVYVALIEYITWIEERLNAAFHAVSVFEESQISVKKSSFYMFKVSWRNMPRVLAIALKQLGKDAIFLLAVTLVWDGGVVLPYHGH